MDQNPIGKINDGLSRAYLSFDALAHLVSAQPYAGTLQDHQAKMFDQHWMIESC
jgi:hypothetical protein